MYYDHFKENYNRKECFQTKNVQFQAALQVYTTTFK